MSAEQHNILVPGILRDLTRNTGSEAEMMIALESVIVGVMLLNRPAPRQAAEFLDGMTMRVIERLGEIEARRT